MAQDEVQQDGSPARNGVAEVTPVKESPPYRASVAEGISIAITPAPVLKRAFAFLIDTGIVTALTYVLFLIVIFALIGIGGIGLMAKYLHVGVSDAIIGIGLIVFMLIFLLVIFAMFDGYFIYFEYKYGATPGKKLFGLKVISRKNAKLTLGQCILRELFRYFDCLLVIPGLLSVLLTDKKLRLGDLAAGTMVVYSRQKEDNEQYTYVSQEDYSWFIEAAKPPAPEPTTCTDFLIIAYPRYILGKKTTDEALLGKWETAIRKFLGDTPIGNGIDRESLFLFFAELCSRTLNKQ